MVASRPVVHKRIRRAAHEHTSESEDGEATSAEKHPGQKTGCGWEQAAETPCLEALGGDTTRKTYRIKKLNGIYHHATCRCAHKRTPAAVAACNQAGAGAVEKQKSMRGDHLKDRSQYSPLLPPPPPLEVSARAARNDPALPNFQISKATAKPVDYWPKTGTGWGGCSESESLWILADICFLLYRPEKECEDDDHPAHTCHQGLRNVLETGTSRDHARKVGERAERGVGMRRANR